MLLNKIINKFLQHLGIKGNDRSKVLWSGLMMFITGALQCYFSAFPIALFLTHYGSSALPKIYLAVAGASVLFGLIYTFFEYRLSFKKLILGLTMTISILWGLLGSALISFNNSLIIVVLLIWAIMAFDLIGLAVWSVLNRIFSLQKAKRFFGIIKGCHSIGGLLAGLLAPLLLHFIALKYLIVGLGLFTLILVIVMATLLRKVQAAAPIDSIETEAVEETEDDLKMNHLIRNKYVLKIFSLIVLGVFSTYIIALLFNTAAEARYPSEVALAGFLGIFFGLVDGVDLFCSLFLFNRLLKRFGLVATLFILPSLGVLVTVPILIFNDIPSLVFLVFWFIVSLKLFEDAVRASLTHMSNMLLLQPFPPKTRAFLQSKSEVIVVGCATAVISCLLIAMVSAIGVSLWFLSALALACFVVSIAILCTLESDYVSALIKAISNRYFEGSELLYPTKEDMDLLKKCLSSKYSDEVIYALIAIERIDLPEFFKVLGTVIQSKNTAVVNYALDKIKLYKLVNYLPMALFILNNSDQNTLKAKALTTATYLDYGKTKKYVHHLMDDNFLPLSSAAVMLVFKHSKETDLRAKAMAKLQELLSSTEEKKRVECAHIIGEVTDPKVNHLLVQLTQDSSEWVRRAAFEAVMKTHYKELYAQLIEHLPFLGMRSSLFDRFFKANQTILTIIIKNFDAYTHEVQVKSLYLMSHIKNKNAQEFIEKIILRDDDSLKMAALHTLNQFNLVIPESFLKKLFDVILREADLLSQQYDYLECTPDVELTGLLRDVLKRKVDLHTERLLLALSIYYDRSLIHKASKGLRAPGENEKSYALELIDTTMEASHKKVISPLLARIYLAESSTTSDLHSEAFYSVLQNNIKPVDAQEINILTSMACVYVHVKGSLACCLGEIKELRHSNIELVVEAIEWVEGE